MEEPGKIDKIGSKKYLDLDRFMSLRRTSILKLSTCSMLRYRLAVSKIINSRPFSKFSNDKAHELKIFEILENSSFVFSRKTSNYNYLSSVSRIEYFACNTIQGKINYVLSLWK